MPFHVIAQSKEGKRKRTAEEWKELLRKQRKNYSTLMLAPSEVDLGVVDLPSKSEVIETLESEGYSKDDYVFIIEEVEPEV